MFTFCFQKPGFKIKFLGNTCSHSKNVHALAVSHTYITTMRIYYLMDNGRAVPVHAMKAHHQVHVQLPSFLTFILDRVEWSASHSGHFSQMEETPGPTKQGVGWTSVSVWML
jgi:hypothetical protein